MITEKEIIQILELQLGIPHVDLEKYFIEPEIPKLIDENLARRHLLIPIRKEMNTVFVAMADPLNIFAIDDVKMVTGLNVQEVIATKQDILNAIEQYYDSSATEKVMEEFKQNYNEEALEKLDEKTLNEINNAPVVKLVNIIINQAVKMKASDIHIEPFEKKVRVRLRIDGDLQEIMNSAKSAHAAIVTRIKIMGKLDIAEKRIPQDGRVKTNIDGTSVNMRISILPTVHGEKIVIRILDHRNCLVTKKQLGFNNHNLVLFEKIIQNPNGMILITGPTGSGKSTTLYTILRELSTTNKNIITVEDPVEYQLDEINQVQVNVKAGMNFSNALRSILRQDPDVIMVGEIRDSETAQIAVKAAITGHLLLSTLHTNDTASTVIRLINMGVEPYLVSSALVGIIAQRLVKKICTNCKTEHIADDLEKEILGIRKNEQILIFKGKGCSKCNNLGYKGRVAIHEIMAVTRNMRIKIDEFATIDQLRNLGMNEGMMTLKQSCSELVIEGVTTVDELLRVVYSVN